MSDHLLISANTEPPELQAFQEGREVEVLCSKPGCEDVKIPAVLGKEQQPRMYFRNQTKIGRFPWTPSNPMKAFRLEKPVTCPKCGAIYTTAVIALQEPTAQPLLCAS